MNTQQATSSSFDDLKQSQINLNYEADERIEFWKQIKSDITSINSDSENFDAQAFDFSEVRHFIDQVQSSSKYPIVSDWFLLYL